METNLVCSSMRKRPNWATLTRALLQQNTARWKGKSSFETHDVAMPLSRVAARAVFRAIFLTPADIGTAETRTRTERLFNLNGGQYVALVLLMEKQDEGESPTAAMMRLQLELVGGLEMPIIPVASVETAGTTLLAFHQQLNTSGGCQKRAEASSLLPYCSDSYTLPEHKVNLLSDITSGLRDLLEQASTAEGREKLAQYLGPDAERVIRFWKEEYPVD
ncbi:uncharacterized protein BCR38DRAFT_340338 [Pseudomassariella vexata]|uniref:Uncharacterized protein n=1 Tax=Pseudomassariella vexata TaxID=1141098 RepID=A0A1Y2E6C7_9PEZI|nr:uncharacterized protein BCR38DRAFT_340338 [Pseudomassariella vexata]ORY66425.1 hypothetical protein BCR38DRAFT_340338 [Pseudomassariella vexata]